MTQSISERVTVKQASLWIIAVSMVGIIFGCNITSTQKSISSNSRLIPQVDHQQSNVWIMDPPGQGYLNIYSPKLVMLHGGSVNKFVRAAVEEYGRHFHRPTDEIECVEWEGRNQKHREWRLYTTDPFVFFKIQGDDYSCYYQIANPWRKHTPPNLNGHTWMATDKILVLINNSPYSWSFLNYSRELAELNDFELNQFDFQSIKPLIESALMIFKGNVEWSTVKDKAGQTLPKIYLTKRLYFIKINTNTIGNQVSFLEVPGA